MYGNSFTYKGQRRKWNPRYLGLINHLVFVVDMSGSMQRLRRAVADFLDAQRRLHADKSEETGQETRISVYLFDTDVECVIYDRDVLRPIDFRSLLETDGMTALRKATLLAIDELSQTSALHGDHAFWLNVITDGHENASRNSAPSQLHQAVTSRMANWTVTCFVPGVRRGTGLEPEQSSLASSQQTGFPVECIQPWDVSVEGVEALGVSLTRATDTFYSGRTSGTRSFTSKGLFGGGEESLNDTTVQQAGLEEVDPSRFAVFTLSERIEARPFCEQKGYVYRNGVVFYEWFNTQDIQPQKIVLFQRVRDGKVFSAPAGSTAARDLLGLDVRTTMRGKPAPNKDYRRFIQSTAPNRKLIPGKHALILDATRA